MKQVKFLNEADRPKEEKLLTFTEWAYNKGGYAKSIAVGTELHEWFVVSLNEAAAKYAAYLASFQTENKKVEFKYFLQKGMIEFWGLRYVEVDTTLYSDFTVIGKHRIADITYTVFVGVRKNGEEHYFLGHLNSSYY